MNGKNIDLGTFQWDTNKIEHQVAANNIEMQKFGSMVKVAKDQIKEQSKEIGILEQKIESERKAQERMRGELEKGFRSQESYNEEMDKSNQLLDEMVAEQIRLGKAQADALIIQNRSQQSIKELRLENNELNKLMAAGRTELSGLEGVYRNTNVEMNAYKIEAKNLGIQLEKLRQEGKENTDEYKKLEVQFVETSKKADSMNDAFKKVDKSVGDNQRTVGDYKDQIVSAFDEIKLGALQLASGNTAQGINTIKSSISGLTSTAKTFYATVLTNPFTWILAAVAGFGLLVKTMWDYNEEVRETNKEISQLTNTSGEVTDELRRNGQAIAETYGKDLKEAVVEQNELMRDFGVSAQEAFDIYNQGLAQGGAANGEFGDSIREYGSLFAQNGYSAKEFIAILNSGIDLGIYSDKLPDAIKEAGLALNEQTKATRDALVNAFGASFSDDLLKRVQSGKITVADGLEEISKQAEKSNLNQQQLAQLTADLFKGAGEDAGGALVVFQAINGAQEIMYGNLTALEQKTVDSAKIYKELEEAKDAAFKSDAVQSMQYQVQELWKKTQIFFLDILAWFQKGDRAIIQSSSYLRGWFKGIPEAASATFQAILKSLAELIKGFQSGGSAISKFLKGDLDGAKADADRFLSSLPNAYKGLQSSLNTTLSNMSKSAEAEQKKTLKSYDDTIKAQAEIQRILGNNKTTGATGDAEAKAAEEARKKAEEANKQAQTKKIADAKKAADEAKKLMEEEAKRSLEIARETASQSAEIAKLELAEYISINAEKLADDKRLTAEKLKIQSDYFDELQKQQLNIAALERSAKETAIQQKIEEIEGKKLLNENDKNEIENLKKQIEIINREYYLKDAEFQKETNEKKKELNKNYEDQKIEDAKLKRSIDFQQRILELEQNNATEYEVNQAQLDEQKANDLTKLEEDRTNGLISLENYEAQKKIIEDKYRQDSEKLEEAKEQSKRSDAANTFGQISQLMGEQTTIGKAAAIAEIGMSGINAVQNAYTTAQESPITVFFPGYPIVQAGLAAAFSAKQAAKIAGFDEGGIVGDGFHIFRSNGDNRLITAKTGEVVLNEKHQEMLGGADIFKMIGVPGFAKSGVVGTPANFATVQNSISNNNIDFELMASMIKDAVMEGSAIGTQSGAQSGFESLSENRRIAQGANF